LKGLRDIVSRFSKGRGAFYVLNPARVEASIIRWRQELPAITPHYAVKCNPEPQLLNLLYDKGVNFDCASQKELLQVQELSRGPMADRIIYANPCKSERDLETAVAIGSPMTVVDSVEEVKKLKGFGALIRIAVDDSRSPMPFSSKFGCPWHHVERIGRAAADAGVPIHGISFHIGSGSEGGFSGAIVDAYQCLLNLRMGVAGAHNPYIIDIGGGFVPSTFSAAAEEIRLAKANVREPFKWIAEPGRYFAADAFDFFVQVIGKKRVGTGSKAQWHYTIDDSLYGQFTCILFDKAQPVWTRIGDGKRPSSPGVIFGRTCDSLDVIAKATMEELEVGDWLYFPKMGAYTKATASEFNGFPTPPVFQASYKELIFQPAADIQRVGPVSAKNIW
jgi:ornithine decarboxylase